MVFPHSGELGSLRENKDSSLFYVFLVDVILFILNFIEV